VKWVPDKTGRFARRPHYLPAELDEECEQLIVSFLQRRHGKVEFPIRTDDLTVLIEEKADLDSCVDLSDEPGDVEGVTEFFSRRRPIVRISETLSQPYLENRLRTTLTHEYGHVHFHQFMFTNTAQSGSLFPGDNKSHKNSCKRDSIVGASENDWMEWQAGYACSALLIPTGALVESVRSFRLEKEIPYANLSVSSEIGQQLISAVASAFQTSKDAARVRLLKKGIFTTTDLKRVGELF
jgi:hypothetical protein